MQSEAKRCKYWACFGEVNQLQLNLGGVVEHLALNRTTVCVETNYGFHLKGQGTTAFADCDISTCRSFHQTHCTLAPASLLYAKVIFPLSSTVVLFADHLGGLSCSAKVLAGFARLLPIVELQPPPSLLVISRRETCTGRDFNRMVAMELLCLLREEHPESPYSFAQIEQMWARRIFDVRVAHRVAPLVLPEVRQLLEDVSCRRRNNGFGLSPRCFRELLQQTINYFTYEPDRPFNVLRALRIRNPTTQYAKTSLLSFLSGRDGNFRRPSIAASCLAFYAYSNYAYVSYGGLVAESFAGRLLLNTPDCNRNLAQFKQVISQMVQKHQAGQRSLVAQHLALMRESGIRLSGCNMCLFNIPIHEFTCGHTFCDRCIRTLCSENSVGIQRLSTAACLLCDKCNLVYINQQPFETTGRVLVLSGGSGSVLKFLYSLRSLLYGHLADYVDLVITSESAAPVVFDYFCFRSSIPECARNLKASKKLRSLWNTPVPVPKSRTFISVLDGQKLYRNYGDGPQLKDAPQIPYTYTHRPFTRNQGKRWAKISPHLADAESDAIWGPGAWSKIEYDGRNPSEARAASSKLLAALFYIAACRVQRTTPLPTTCEIEVKCRLTAGPHLNAVVRALMQDGAILHCSCSESRIQVQLCDRDIWRNVTSPGTETFSRKIEIETESIDSSLECKIETKMLGNCEHLGNSPCSMVELVNDLSVAGLSEEGACSYPSQDNPSTDRSYLRLHSMSKLDDQIEELEGFLADWK